MEIISFSGSILKTVMIMTVFLRMDTKKCAEKPIRKGIQNSKVLPFRQF